MTQQQTVAELIKKTVTESVYDLLASYGYEPSVTEPPGTSSERLYSAALGYTSPDVQGVLVVVGPASLWGAVYVSLVGQAPASPLTPEGLCDVAGEFSNVTVGRIKRALLSEGVEVGLAVPSGASGIDLRSETLGHDGDVHLMYLATPDGVLTVCNSAVIDPNIMTRAITDSSAPLASEGELLMF